MNRRTSSHELERNENELLLSLDFESVPRPEFASRYSYNAGSGMTANKALFPGSNSIAGKTRPESGCGEENTEEEGGCDIRKGDCECGQGQSEPAASKVSLGSAIYDPVNGEGCPGDEHKDDQGEQEDGCDLDDDSTCRICYRGCHHDQPGCYDKSSCANPGGGYMAIVRGSTGFWWSTCNGELAEEWREECKGSGDTCCTGARACGGTEVHASGCCTGCFFGLDECCGINTGTVNGELRWNIPFTVPGCCEDSGGGKSCPSCGGNGGGNGGSGGGETCPPDSNPGQCPMGDGAPMMPSRPSGGNKTPGSNAFCGSVALSATIPMQYQCPNPPPGYVPVEPGHSSSHIYRGPGNAKLAEIPGCDFCDCEIYGICMRDCLGLTGLSLLGGAVGSIFGGPIAWSLGLLALGIAFDQFVECKQRCCQWYGSLGGGSRVDPSQETPRTPDRNYNSGPQISTKHQSCQCIGYGDRCVNTTGLGPSGSHGGSPGANPPIY